MELETSLINGKSLDGHFFTFEWTFDLPVYENKYGDHNQKVCPWFEHTHKYLSPEFAVSEKCPIKLQMICQELFVYSKDKIFEIGLQRNDESQSALDGSCSVEIKIADKKTSTNSFFEFHQLLKGQQCLTPSLILKIPFGTNIVQCNRRSILSGTIDKTIWITGTITSLKCCETKTKENEVLDKNFTQLQQDFKCFFRGKRITDVTLNVGNELLQAHKFVLCARSPVFQRMFSQDFVEGNQNNVRIDDIDKRVMEVFLSFLYTGVIEDREFSTVFELYSVADKYEVATLFETCRRILTSLLSIHTVSPVLKLADMHSDGDLKEIAVKYICDNFSNVEKTAEWEELLDEHPRLASHALRRVSASIPK